jgi:hypothetical protein
MIRQNHYQYVITWQQCAPALPPSMDRPAIFNANIITKALLHFWSLGVEVQRWFALLLMLWLALQG